MKTILIIDDDKPFRRMLRLTLERMGHAIQEAADGLQAIELFPLLQPDLVITDLIMPEKEGLETIQQLKQLDPALKIIAMSGGGRTSPEDLLKIARYLGANYVLPKPFSTAQLEAALETCRHLPACRNQGILSIDPPST